jgi:hypothetical protein
LIPVNVVARNHAGMTVLRKCFLYQEIQGAWIVAIWQIGTGHSDFIKNLNYFN